MEFLPLPLEQRIKLVLSANSPSCVNTRPVTVILKCKSAACKTGTKSAARNFSNRQSKNIKCDCFLLYSLSPGKSKFKITKLPHSEKCDVTFVPVGCFNDKHGSPRPLPREILNDRDSSRSTFSGQYIQWKNWDNYLPDFICRCAKKAAKNNYKIIGVQYYGKVL